MKILMCNNFYQFYGGEERVFELEKRMLEASGHEIIQYTRSNKAIASLKKLDLIFKTIWNRKAYQDIRALIQKEKPDLLHCTNFFPLISPSIFAAARSESVPTVLTVHNYRLLCPGSYLLRNNAYCESCMDSRFKFQAIRHRCYRNSYAMSGLTTVMLYLHHLAGTWQHQVDRYIALTEYSRDILIRGGLPGEKISVKPNFIDPAPSPGSGDGGYAVFAGRLSPEKGIQDVLTAWSLLDSPIELHIMGEGPLNGLVRKAAADDPRIHWHGHQPHHKVIAHLKDAAFSIFPSRWNEMFGLFPMESLSCGTPVIAYAIGKKNDIIEHLREGLITRQDTPEGLADAITLALENPALLQRMRPKACRKFVENYTADINQAILEDIYQSTLNGFH